MLSRSACRIGKLILARGTYTDAVPLAVNDAHILITKNLMEFVKVIWKSHSNNIYFWADQISMNQKDVKERNHQVNLMSRIYEDATMVYAYLGEGHEKAHLMQESAESRTWEKYAELVAALDEIYARPYWSRLWILQELCLASSTIFWIGEEDFEFEILAQHWIELALDRNEGPKEIRSIAFHENTHVAKQNSESLGQCSDAVDLVLASWRNDYVMGERGQDLETILYKSRGNLCADPHDRIYGVQALVRKSQRVPVDYNLSLRQLSITVLRRIAARATAYFEDFGWSNFDRSLQRCVEIQLDLHESQQQSEKIIEMVFWGSRIACAGSWGNKWVKRGSRVMQYWTDIYNYASTSRQKALAIDLEYLMHLHVPPWRHIVQPAWLEKRSVPLNFWLLRHQDAKEADVRSVIESAMSKHGFVWYGDIIAHPDDWPLKEISSPVLPSGHNVEYFYHDSLTPAVSDESAIADTSATLAGRHEPPG